MAQRGQSAIITLSWNSRIRRRETMKLARLLTATSIAFAMLVAGTFASTSDGNSQTEKVVASFLKHLDSIEVNAAAIAEAKKSVEEMGTDSPDAVTEGLIQLYPKYSKAVDSSDADNTSEAINLLTPLVDSEDKFLAADAGFYLARTLMNSERFEEALPLLKELNGKLADYSVHQGSSQYFVGVAQAGLLEKEQAIQSFMNFLSFNPDAPERLRVSAWRQVQQLQAITDGKLDDVYQRMDYSRRRLTLKETGEKTQAEQDKIVNMLTKLIKEEEKKECSSNCKKGGT